METLAVVRPNDPTITGPGRPLSRSLERQLIAICAQQAPRYIEALPCTEAPSTLAELVEETAHFTQWDSETGHGALLLPGGERIGERFPVWSGASVDTIWSGPRVNYLFRAWHDSLHVALSAELDLAGELELARAHCAMIEGKPERSILWAETAGQVQYFYRWGCFPSRQRIFVSHCFRFGVEQTVDRGLYHDTEGGQQ